MTCTPGPWEVGEYDHNGQATVRAEHFEVAVCLHHCVGSIESEMRANARLIAAAPDYADAAREIDRLSLVILSAVNFADAENLSSVSAALKSTRSAIAKAAQDWRP